MVSPRRLSYVCETYISIEPASAFLFLLLRVELFSSSKSEAGKARKGKETFSLFDAIFINSDVGITELPVVNMAFLCANCVHTFSWQAEGSQTYGLGRREEKLG